MRLLQRSFFLFFLLMACSAYAQQDTTGGDQGWMSMPVVTDSAAAAAADTQYIPVPNADSLKKAKQDSLARENVDEKEFIKNEIKMLCAKGMAGRGYVKNGLDSAARYILKRFKAFGLKPVKENGPYAQGFAFPVNTFPGKMEMFVNGDSLLPGIEYVVHPASSSFLMDSSASRLKVKKVNLHKVRDTADWMAKLAKIDSGHAYYLENMSDATENLEIREDKLLAMLPGGVYILPKEKKLTWSVRREPMAATVLYVRDDSMPKRIKNVKLNIEARHNPHQRCENIIAQVPGEIKDSFIVFTAPYDHLGMMGGKVTFQGASDNASGVAMMLYLARYFSKHPQKYSILFIAFAGEEASLMGSEFFAWHPFVPLGSIRFLVNIDIMGDATNGVTVVNAVENAGQVAALQAINDREKYLRVIMPRENSANSDHYHFSKRYVPAIFLYSNGGNGFYHDVYDVKTALSLNNVNKVSRLLIDFVSEFKYIPPVIAPKPDDPTAINTSKPQAGAEAPAETTTPGETAPPAEPSATPAETSTPPAEPQKPEEPSPTPQETPGQ